jgi:hypothetical protein
LNKISTKAFKPTDIPEKQALTYANLKAFENETKDMKPRKSKVKHEEKPQTKRRRGVRKENEMEEEIKIEANPLFRD